MSKITELKKLVEQMRSITCDDDYLQFVGFQSDWDYDIVEAIDKLSEAINSRDVRYYIPPIKED